MAEHTPRWKIAAPLILTLLLFAAWSAYWWIAIQFAETKFAEGRTRLENIMSLECGSENWGGYPYRFVYTCTNARISLKRNYSVLTSAKLELLTQAYNPNHIISILTGPTRFTEPRNGIDLTAEHLPAVSGIKLNRGKFRLASTQIKDLVVRQSGKDVFAASQIDLHARPASKGQSGYDVAFDARTVQIISAPAPAIALDTVSGEINADRLPAGIVTNLVDLARGSAAAGTVFTLNRLDVRAGTITANASGSTTINNQGQLNGALKTRVENLDGLLDDLTARNAVTKKQARTAASLLGLFKSQGDIAADLRFKDGQIYWGPLKLGQHAPLF